MNEFEANLARFRAQFDAPESADWCATIMKSAVATTMMAGGEESKAA